MPSAGSCSATAKTRSKGNWRSGKVVLASAAVVDMMACVVGVMSLEDTGLNWSLVAVLWYAQIEAMVSVWGCVRWVVFLAAVPKTRRI